MNGKTLFVRPSAFARPFGTTTDALWAEEPVTMTVSETRANRIDRTGHNSSFFIDYLPLY